MIRFYTNPRSRGAIVRWMLEEVGQPYETQILDYGTTMKAPEYLALNPMGKVPAIVHDGVVVTEGAAICTYLAETFPEAGLAPTATERGAYYRWMFFGAGPVEAAVTNKALGVQVPPERKGAVGYGSLEEVVATLEGRLAESAYLAGDRFTAVDVYTGSQIGWGMMFGTLPKIAAFTDYWDRIKDRPARLAAVEKDS
ncbi:glutathione S-transferase family protein [Cereibacter sphaeroides]|nr:glutathione S-transferase family protein [Cereibacter sphaeroides]